MMTETQETRATFLEEAAEDLAAARERMMVTGKRVLPSRNWTKEAVALGFTVPEFREELARALRKRQQDGGAMVNPFQRDSLQLSDADFWARAVETSADALGEDWEDEQQELWIARAAERGEDEAEAAQKLSEALADLREVRATEEQKRAAELAEAAYRQAEKSVHIRLEKKGDNRYLYETSVRVTGTGIDVIAVEARLLREADEVARAECLRREEADRKERKW